MRWTIFFVVLYCSVGFTDCAHSMPTLCWTTLNNQFIPIRIYNVCLSLPHALRGDLQASSKIFHLVTCVTFCVCSCRVCRVDWRVICRLSLFLFVRLMGSKWKKNSKTDFKGSTLRILHPGRQASCTLITVSIGASFFSAMSLKEPEVYHDRCCRSWANDQKRCSTEHCHQLAMSPALPIISMTLSSILAIHVVKDSRYKDHQGSTIHPTESRKWRSSKDSQLPLDTEDIFSQNISEHCHFEVEKRRSQRHQDLQLGGLSSLQKFTRLQVSNNHWTAGMETDLESAQIYADIIKLRKETPPFSSQR